MVLLAGWLLGGCCWCCWQGGCWVVAVGRVPAVGAVGRALGTHAHAHPLCLPSCLPAAMMAEHVPGAEPLLTVRDRFWTDAALSKASMRVCVLGVGWGGGRQRQHEQPVAPAPPHHPPPPHTDGAHAAHDLPLLVPPLVRGVLAAHALPGLLHTEPKALAAQVRAGSVCVCGGGGGRGGVWGGEVVGGRVPTCLKPPTQ